MGYSTQIAISLLLFVAFTFTGNAFTQVGGPWSNSQTADLFMNSFCQYMGNSGVLSGEQLNDMNSMSQTMIAAMDRMSKQGKSSGHKLQALNMAFASSVAEIAMSEGADTDAIANAVSNALISAFLQTTGNVDTVFVNEITQIIKMFAQVEYDMGGNAATAGASASATSYGTGASAGAGGAGGYSSGTGAGGYGVGTGGTAVAGAGAGAGTGGAGSYNQYSSSSVSSAGFSQSGYGVGSGTF